MSTTVNELCLWFVLIMGCSVFCDQMRFIETIYLEFIYKNKRYRNIYESMLLNTEDIIKHSVK